MNKITMILIEVVPIALMILLIPNMANDYILSLIYLAIIGSCFLIRYEKKDFMFFILGLIIMTILETFFILTGVESFNRETMFGIMPVWLPILWAYSFVVIKRSINILR